MRNFLQFAKKQGYTIYILSQEKTGYFVDHLSLIGNGAPEGSYFIPDNNYIRTHIQHRQNTGGPYGIYTNYGAKIFVKISNFHQMVINIPTGLFVENPTFSDLLGADKIFATLPQILSNRFEGALLPVELANGVASLSTYPSAQILKIFSDEYGK